MVNQTAVSLIEGSSPKLAHKTPCQIQNEEVVNFNSSISFSSTPFLVCLIETLKMVEPI